MLNSITDISPLAIEQSHKFHIIKFKAVVGKLIEFETKKYFTQTHQNILIFLSELKAIALLKNGTDFFWLSIHRLYSSLKKNENQQTFEKMYSYFLMNAFDSFYFLLPEKSFIEFSNNDNDNIPLINLKISLPFSKDKKVCLTKSNETFLNYNIYYDEFEISPNYNINIRDIPNHHNLNCSELNKHNNLLIVYNPHQNIFEEGYINQCSENAFWGYQIVNKITHSLEQIQKIDYNLYTKITTTIRYIIPLGSNKKINPPNFSSAMLKRCIFLSIFSEGFYTIANLIHEFSHCELHFIQDTILLTIEDDKNISRYYSPWRIDHRPLLGLIHGIYVTYAVIDFFYKMLQSKISDFHTNDIKHRIEIMANQIIIGIKQINNNTLTNFSSNLLNEIFQFATKISNELNFDFQNPPSEIIKHKNDWITENKGYLIVE